MQFEPSAVPAHFGIRTKDYKLIFFYGHGLGLHGTTDGWITPVRWELYDLQKDPNELNNIYGKEEYATITTQLKANLRQLQDEYQLNIKDYPQLKIIIDNNWDK